MQLTHSLLLLPFSLVMLVTAVPLNSAPNDHYTEADIMQLRLAGQDQKDFMSHLGLKASTPSYQLASENAPFQSSEQSSDGFALVPHQEFEKEKRRQLNHHRRHSLRNLASRLIGGSDVVLTAGEEDPLDVRSKGLKPQYLTG